MNHSLGYRLRHVARTVGKVAVAVLIVTGKTLEAVGETPIPCSGCQQEFPFKTLRRVYDIPKFANSLYFFCPDCRARIRQEQRIAGIFAREQRRVIAQFFRALDHGLPASLTLEQWIVTLNHYRWRCAYCLDGPYEAIDHFIPVGAGGGTTADNCVPSCKSCNSSKGSRHPDTIRESSRSPTAIARVRAYLQPTAEVAAPGEDGGGLR